MYCIVYSFYDISYAHFFLPSIHDLHTTQLINYQINNTNNSYFDFFEEAFNYIAYKGYIRMPKDDEAEWMDTMNNVHASVKGGMKYNTGKLLMVLYRPIDVDKE